MAVAEKSRGTRKAGEKQDEKKNPHGGHRERKKQQFLRYGLDAFADHEALELLLYYARPQIDVNPIAHALIDRFGSLNAVLSAPAEELVKVDGVQMHTALLLTLVPQLYRKARMSLTRSEVILDTTQRQGEYFLELFTAEASEVLYELCLDAKGRKLQVYRLGSGDVGSVGLNVRNVVENALRCSAVMVVLAHNHPSGVALPSREDVAATRQIQEALEPVGIRLLDHIIAADNDFVSMRQSGCLD